MKEDVWECDGSKSSGPNGFNLNYFIKECWMVVKQDILGFYEEFHSLTVISKAISASFLALISNMDDPQCLKDWRPIFWYE